MMKRFLIGLTVGVLAVGGLGCGKETKPTIPTKMLEPPGPDSVGGDGGSKSKKVKHTDIGEKAGANDG